mgnify:FL=1
MQLGRIDELGSGILNVNKYIEAYSGKDYPQFIEGARFKTIIPVKEVLVGAVDGANDGANDGAIEGAIEGATDGVKNRLVEISSKMCKEPGIKAVELQEISMFPKELFYRILKN